ncbi:hypothetical protein JTE90_017268 [Oedothorax gibbosus]|uniref:Uncharacterized protein n=1 Tax=Oedothorax gibbosus TaxID=931172 RepID=A0AAV6VDZ0_9ARAC|nr:hypothetical protein JTE90_017268 [Oedothorax gibbosus]
MYPQQLKSTRQHLKKSVSGTYSNSPDNAPDDRRTIEDYDGGGDFMDKESDSNFDPSRDESEFEDQLDSAEATMLQEALYSDVTTQSSKNRAHLNVIHEPPKKISPPVTPILEQDNAFMPKNKELIKKFENTKNESESYISSSETSMSSKSSFYGTKQDSHWIKNKLDIYTHTYSNTSRSQSTMGYGGRFQDRHEMKDKLNIKTDSYGKAPWSNSKRRSLSSYDGMSEENFETNKQTSVQSTNQEITKSTLDTVYNMKILTFTEVTDVESSTKSKKHITMEAAGLSAVRGISSRIPGRHVRDDLKHKVQRISRKEPKVNVLTTKNTKVETKAWKSAVKVGNSEILPHHLKFDLKPENLVGPQTEVIQTTTHAQRTPKACVQKDVTCEMCTATSPQCHYNHTGKFCFYSSIIHRNNIYECGTRFVAADGYGPVMGVAGFLALSSVGVALYLVSAAIQKRRSASLPEEEVDAMRQQVQFVRDRRTNNFKKIMERLNNLKPETDHPELQSLIRSAETRSY